jgi:hypothetical protein
MTVIINELLGIARATQIKGTWRLLGYQGVGVKRNSARQHDTLRATEQWKTKSLPPAIMETRGSGSTAPVYSLVTTLWRRDLHAPATLTRVYFGQEAR